MRFTTVLMMILLFAACKKDEPIHPDIQSGLVANIPLNGNGYDSVSNTIGAGSHISAAPNRHNVDNQSVLFSRDDSSFIDFGDLANASFPNNVFTISCWINVIDTILPEAILSKRNITGPWEYSFDNHFHLNRFNLDNWVPDGSTSVYGTDPLSASIIPSVNSWHHVAYVADGSTLSVYLDGVLQVGTDQHNSSLFLGDTDAHFVIGNGGGYGQNYYFNGCVDDIRIYNRALDVETIQYLTSL